MLEHPTSGHAAGTPHAYHHSNNSRSPLSLARPSPAADKHARPAWATHSTTPLHSHQRQPQHVSATAVTINARDQRHHYQSAPRKPHRHPQYNPPGVTRHTEQPPTTTTVPTPLHHHDDITSRPRWQRPTITLPTHDETTSANQRQPDTRRTSAPRSTAARAQPTSATPGGSRTIEY